MNIVDINKYTKKREIYKMKGVDNLLTNLRDNYSEKHNNYTLSEIDNIAYDILSTFGFMSKNISTPIVKIAKQFGFNSYKILLNDRQSGCIYINGETFEKYGENQIILVNKKEALYHQRFVIAHELAHYLFDFVGNPAYSNKDIQYSDTYYRDKHNRPEELIANRFAASLLMPRDLFIRQYQIAKRTDANRMFIIMYLSKFFETSMDSIVKRIEEVIL